MMNKILKLIKMVYSEFKEFSKEIKIKWCKLYNSLELYIYIYILYI